MASMVVMAWLVIASMTMTGVLEKIGFIDRLLQSLMRLIVSTRSLIATTMATSIGVNVLTGDQYLSIILPGQMWRSQYKQRKLAPINLSRALEDAGTITSPLIPWNGCGVYMAGALGVATLDYLPYTFFNLLSPVLSLAFVMLGWKIARLPSSTADVQPSPKASAT
jgi:NhaC family Na+:H+ antiporter